MRLITTMIMILLACDPVPGADFREGTTGGGGCPQPPPPPPLDGCTCEPGIGACAPGLDCVPVGTIHACLARCGGLTTCETDGQELACVYPYADPNLGTGPAFCPACLGCSPIPAGSLACQ